MQAIKLFHVVKTFYVTDAHLKDAHNFHQLIAATCVAREVPHEILMGHLDDLRYDLVASQEDEYKFIYGNTTYHFVRVE